MNTPKFITVISLLAFALALHLPSFGQESSTAKERIGVYDSRAVVLAFVGSPSHERLLVAMKAKYKKAKKAGDKELIAKMESDAKARLAMFCKQEYSTAIMDEILAQIAEKLPEIQKNAEVSDFVSKWDEATLKQHPGAETIDVTMDLVNAFHPNERQRKCAIEIQKHTPTPLDQNQYIKD